MRILVTRQPIWRSAVTGQLDRLITEGRFPDAWSTVNNGNSPRQSQSMAMRFPQSEHGANHFN